MNKIQGLKSSDQPGNETFNSSLLSLRENDTLNVTFEAMNLESFKEKPENIIYQNFDLNDKKFAHEGFLGNFEGDFFEDCEEINFDFDKPETIPRVQVVDGRSVDGILDVENYFSGIVLREKNDIVLESVQMVKFCYENNKKDDLRQ
jgi:hypothetical protein